VRRNEAVMQTMVDRGRHFWNTYVRTATPPPVDGSEGAREMLKLLYPRAGAEPLPADPELEALAAKLAAARAALDLATEEKRLRENEIKARLKDARGAFGDGWSIRYSETKAGTRPFVFTDKEKAA
jgi:predicted phage-related endonuclease